MTMFNRTAKKSISPNERLQLIGLLTLARRHNAALVDLRSAALAITGEQDGDGVPDDCGHTSDAIYSDYDADDLLRRLEIAVEEPPAIDAVARPASAEGAASQLDPTTRVAEEDSEPPPAREGAPR